MAKIVIKQFFFYLKNMKHKYIQIVQHLKVNLYEKRVIYKV